MPLGGEAFGNSLAGFFPDPGPDRLSYSEGLMDTMGQQVTRLSDLGKSAKDAAAKYAAAIMANTPQAEMLNQERIATLGDLAKQYAAFDPASTYERIRGGNISSLANQFVNLANYGEQGDKAALAKMGYGGRGPGSYESILRADRISRNIAPVLNTIYGNLGADTTNLNTGRLSNLAATLGLLRERSAAPDFTAGRNLLPYQAESDMLGNEIALGGNLAEAVKANTAGYQQRKNKWANFFQQQGRAFDQVADTAIDLYSGYLTGGLGGGGGIGAAAGAAGAAKGGGGGMSAPPPAYYSSYATSYNPGYTYGSFNPPMASSPATPGYTSYVSPWEGYNSPW